MKIALLCLFFFSAPAFAANVFVVGGATSKTAQLRRCYPSYTVAGINESGSIKGKLLQALQSKDGAILAGHSNGWAKVQAMALGVPSNLRSRLTLVNLDGGSSARVNGKGFRRVRCVNARNARGGLSRNYGSSGSCQAPQTIRNSGAAAGWALHFAVMNANVPKNLCGPSGRKDGHVNPACWWPIHGFDSCKGVTDWAKP